MLLTSRNLNGGNSVRPNEFVEEQVTALRVGDDLINLKVKVTMRQPSPERAATSEADNLEQWRAGGTMTDQEEFYRGIAHAVQRLQMTVRNLSQADTGTKSSSSSRVT